MDDIRLEISQLSSCSTINSSLAEVGAEAHLVCVYNIRLCPSQQNELRMEFNVPVKVRSKIWAPVIDLTLHTLVYWQVWGVAAPTYISYWLLDYVFLLSKYFLCFVFFFLFLRNWFQLPSGHSYVLFLCSKTCKDGTFEGWMEEHQEEQDLKCVHLDICTGRHCSNISMK